jgi:hypothetical protein
MDTLDALPTASELITRADAYRAMFHLIKYYYRFGNDYPVGAMLGDLCPGIWGNGMPGDPAAWELWLDAIAGKLPQPD